MRRTRQRTQQRAELRARIARMNIRKIEREPMPWGKLRLTVWTWKFRKCSSWNLRVEVNWCSTWHTSREKGSRQGESGVTKLLVMMLPVMKVWEHLGHL
jgi:hypothetical protein